MDNKQMNPLAAVLLGFAIAILSALIIPIVVVTLLALIGVITLGVACPEVAIAILIVCIIIGFPTYIITLAVCHK